MSAPSTKQGTGRRLYRPLPPAGRGEEAVGRLYRDMLRTMEDTERALAEQDRKIEALRGEIAVLKGETT